MAALRRRKASSGLTSQPSASERRARNTSAVAVEQHQDRHVGQPAGARLEAEVHAGGHAAHVADLQVEHDEVGRRLGHGGEARPPLPHPTHGAVGRREGGLDLVADPVGVGGDQDVRHGGRLAARPRGEHLRRGWRTIRRRDPRPPPGGRVLDIEVEDVHRLHVCRPVGELDAYTVGQFREPSAELAASPRLLIDLSAVPFMDSAGLGALIGGIRRAREAGGDVAVACSRPTLTRLLHTTGLRPHRLGHRDGRSGAAPCADAAADTARPRTLSAKQVTSPTSARPSRSCTSVRRNGTRTTGAGATRSASPARCSSSRDATSRKSARLA